MPLATLSALRDKSVVKTRTVQTLVESTAAQVFRLSWLCSAACCCTALALCNLGSRRQDCEVMQAQLSFLQLLPRGSARARVHAMRLNRWEHATARVR